MSEFVFNRRSLLRLTGTGLAAALLTACGRKASPVLPEGADPQYPRRYPTDRNAPPGSNAPPDASDESNPDQTRTLPPFGQPQENSPFLYRR
jgi:hypothetical protein